MIPFHHTRNRTLVAESRSEGQHMKRVDESQFGWHDDGMGTWGEGKTSFICSGCKAVWRCSYRDYPQRDRGKFDCTCGVTVYAWNGTRDYTDFELAEADTKSEGEQHPARRQNAGSTQANLCGLFGGAGTGSDLVRVPAVTRSDPDLLYELRFHKRARAGRGDADMLRSLRSRRDRIALTFGSSFISNV